MDNLTSVIEEAELLLDEFLDDAGGPEREQVRLECAVPILVVADGEVLREALRQPRFGVQVDPGAEADQKVRSIGSNTGRLTPVERAYDPYTGIPRMSDIPVNVRRYEGALAD